MGVTRLVPPGEWSPPKHGVVRHVCSLPTQAEVATERLGVGTRYACDGCGITYQLNGGGWERLG